MKNSDVLFQEFKLATKQICADLSLEYKNIEFTRYETKKTGIAYIATMSNDSPQFSFHIGTTTKDIDPTLGPHESRVRNNLFRICQPILFL